MILLALACSAPDAVAPPGTVPAWIEHQNLPALDLDDPLFERVIAIDLTLHPDDIDALRGDPRTYVPGTLRFEDRVFERVGVRLKGEESFLPIDQKPSWKIKLDWEQEQRLFGLTDLTFNNLRHDESMLHERIAYWAYRSAGVPAARTGHAEITLNGEYYGLYSHIETVDARLLKRWYGEVDRMWEVKDVDFKPEFVDGFLLEAGVDDPAPLQAVTSILHEERPFTELTEHMDMDQFALFYAVSAVVGQFDAYPFTYPGDDAHVAIDPATGLLQWLPHGLDESMNSQSTRVTWIRGDVGEACLDEPVCRDLLGQRSRELLLWLEDQDWVGRIETVRAEIREAALADTRRPYDVGDIVHAQLDVLDFAQNRRADLFSQF